MIVPGTVVLLGHERFEDRERRGFANAFRRLGWSVVWWPHEGSGFRRTVEDLGRAIVIHPDISDAPVPAEIATVSAPTVVFQFDTFTYPDVRIRRSMLFDVVCCFHPGWPERFEREGHPGAMLLPHAIDDAQFAELKRPRPVWDIGWVGRVDGPLYRNRRRLLPILAAEFEMNTWTSKRPMDEVPDIYASSRIVVSIPRDDWRPDANLRVFEAMAAGALLITPMPSELTELGFVDGRHFVGYVSEDALPSLVRQYLDDGRRRARIARAGRDRVLADHTYMRRAESILQRAFAEDRPMAPARRWPRRAVAQVILEQYVQERRWRSLAWPARGVIRRAGWRAGAAAWYVASHAVSRQPREEVVRMRDPGSNPSVSVVIPTWRRADWLGRCLDGLLSQAPTPVETLVVGRAGDPDARAVAKDRGERTGREVRWLEVDRPGHVAPVLRGLEEASGDVVAFLDDDVVPQPGWLRAIVEPFADPSVACVGGRVVTPGQRARVDADAGRIRWYGRHIGNVAMLDGPGTVDVDGVMECNWVWRRSALERLRFDPQLDFDDASMYGLDLTLQVRAGGMRVVYQPAAVVVNASAPRDPSLDRRDRAARTFSYSRNYSLIASRHLRGLRRVVFWLWWFLVGERGSYGLATGAVDLATRRADSEVVAASFRGKLAGGRLWLGG
jgi:GT2 family glycosyltransferase